MAEYNLVVIGAGSAGQYAARKAAYFGHRVAVVDKMTGALTTIRRMNRIMHKIYGLQDAGFIPREGVHGAEDDATKQKAEKLRDELKHAFFDFDHNEDEEIDAIRGQLNMRNIEIIQGEGSFLNLDELEVVDANKRKVIEGHNFIIAVGARQDLPDEFPYDGKNVHSVKSIFNMEEPPKALVIFGGHEMSCQFAIVFALMGTRVKVVTKEECLFPLLDEEIRKLLIERFETYGIEFQFKADIDTITVAEANDGTTQVTTRLTNESICVSDMLLYTAGYVGRTSTLGCDEAGIDLDYYGSIVVDREYHTSVPHIYAVGDVVKSPTIESVRKHQGLKAVKNTFGFENAEELSEEFPVGIYTLPEVAFYGMTEEQVKKTQIKYVVGRANYKDIPYGRVTGRQTGCMKLVVNSDTEEIIGVHVIGRGAEELVHFGMQLVVDQLNLGKIIGTVFNGNSLHELYNFAAMDAITRIRSKR